MAFENVLNKCVLFACDTEFQGIKSWIFWQICHRQSFYGVLFYWYVGIALDTLLMTDMPLKAYKSPYVKTSYC